MINPTIIGQKKELYGNDGNSTSPSPPSRAFDLKEMGKRAAEEAEREHIKNTLAYTNWNRKAAARLLQISYKALLNKIDRYQISALRDQKNKKGSGNGFQTKIL